MLSGPAEAATRTPLPKPRPVARNIVPATNSAAAPTNTEKSADKPAAAAPVHTAHAGPAAPLGAPPRSPAAMARKPITPAAVAATSSTSQGDKDALENVIELLRKRKPDDATQAEAAISDPVARKLAEWLILRSDNNNVSVERYRAFLAANPSWPSQTFLRRRLEAALWDDKREDSAIWSWFENESPVSAKGRLALAKAMIARGDRTNAERLVRQA
ncbi:MAG: lytic transglycosylase domain-containing protein, partial [Bradyrhizobium sp.]